MAKRGNRSVDQVVSGESRGSGKGDDYPEEVNWNEWQGPKSSLGRFIADENAETIESYKARPSLVTEQVNHETDLQHGGYQYRQIVELTQNSADTMPASGGGIRCHLTKDALYFADDGNPINESGVRALLQVHLSEKRATDEIGRFGLGFKSLLRISDCIEFYSRAGSFRFDREWSRREILAVKEIGSAINRDTTPAMRLAEPISAREGSEGDEFLRSLFADYNNVIKVRLLSSSEHARTFKQMQEFPSEFLLLIDKVNAIELSADESDFSARVGVRVVDGVRHLDAGGKSRPWHRFDVVHDLSPAALADRRTHDESASVRISWAVPADGSRVAGHFWNFFPTAEPTLLSGILNGPWNTNEDRTGLIRGPYNADLLEGAARLVAENLHRLSVPSDPARHLDALPPRRYTNDRDLAIELRERIFGHLTTREVVPDKSGRLRIASEIYYPPIEFLAHRNRTAEEAAYLEWSDSVFAPGNALFTSAADRERWIKVEQIFDPNGNLSRSGRRTRTSSAGSGLNHPSIAQWLERLTTNRSRHEAGAASRDAIRVAATLPLELRMDPSELGLICLTQVGEWRTLTEVSLPLDASYGGRNDEILVHQDLASDRETNEDLRMLGVNEISSLDLLEEELRALSQLHEAIGNRRRSGGQSDSLFGNVYRVTAAIATSEAIPTIKAVPSWRSVMRARTVSGDWAPLSELLLPGGVFKEGQARQVCVDTIFHQREVELLRALGLSDGPQATSLDEEPWQDAHTEMLRERYRGESHPSGRTPNAKYVSIRAKDGVGPLTPFHSAYLTDRDVAAYTDSVLRMPEAFAPWTVAHTNQTSYLTISYDGMTADYLKRYGKLDFGSGRVVQLSDIAEGDDAAIAELHQYRTWPLIRKLLNLQETEGRSGDYEAIRPDSGESISDRWPGVGRLLGTAHADATIVLCDAIAYQGTVDRGYRSFRDGEDVYVVRDEDQKAELGNALRELGIIASDGEIEDALQHDDGEVRMQRQRVRECESVEAKLLQAVGTDALMLELPDLLKDYSEWKDESLEGIAIARAAIATYHTGVLKRYRRYIGHLDPPRQWAGGRPIRQFIADLGFPPDWAGAPRRREDPYEDVLGPFTLPDLHEYQQRIVDVVRQMATQPRANLNRRALVSLPTGAGKTRVAVQAIVEAIRDGFEGEVLWVADRRELLEQAVESWQQVWRCIGPERGELRISRVYDGQPMPTETTGSHVIVASIQTLYSRFGGKSNPETLSRVGLVVLDEAHHAIAPTYTTLMDTLGFGNPGTGRGPILLGLTATPYRGMNAEETRRLVNRFESNRLDRIAFDGLIDDDPEEVIRYLQDHDPRVLAIARHKTIDGDQIILDAAEAAQAQEYPWLPDSAERRLAQSAERTDRILDAYEREIRSKPEHWPTLIFATSVEHAQTLAAELTLRDISARSVSSETESSTRRRIVEEYRNGDVKVLVNYGVFREGFDAPKTRAVIIARPAFSANLYFQMIGRGLRGPANGGNPDCLIIDVEDNIINFKGRLAFTELEDFWDR